MSRELPRVRTTRACQKSLAQSAIFSGVGVHSGKHCTVRVGPAESDSGINFYVRGMKIPAHAKFVSRTNRATCLERGEAQVHTVEHLLSALAGLQIDNVDVYVDGVELPILDGSARMWIEGLKSAGICQQMADRRVRHLEEAVALNMGQSTIVAVPSERLRYTVVTHYDHPMLGTQVYAFEPSVGGMEYEREIGPARTFGFIEEVEKLQASGLALGGSIENALIVYPDHFSDELRVPDECTRHKMLDLIGDLSLSGFPVIAEITAIRPGHQINSAFAGLLSQVMS